MTGLQFPDWRASILAADFADWITVAAYAFGALLAVRAAGCAWGHAMRREHLFWTLCTFLMVALGINELFDFQTYLTTAGRAWAKAEGVYEHARTIQLAFVVVLALVSTLALAGILALTRKTDRSIKMALLGLIFIGAFVLLRAASFHHADAMLGLGPNWFRYGSIQEVAGILFVAWAAGRYPFRPQERSCP